jgi:hypothetical protein
MIRHQLNQNKFIILVVFFVAFLFGFVYWKMNYAGDTPSNPPKKTLTEPLATSCPDVKPCPPPATCPKCYQCSDDASVDKLLPPGLTDGQVTMGTGFGKALNKLAKQDDVKLFLEIGTWFGAGSTMSIATGLKESGPEKLLYTIEIFEPAWLYARKKLRDFPVMCLLGGTVTPSLYLTESEIPPDEKGDHFRLYYHRDMKLAAFQVPLLEPLCKNFKFDAVLIDGNEYSGWGEFNLVKDECKPKYLALHDVGTLKTRKISAYLDQNKDEWKLLDGGVDGAQWQIWLNQKYQK